MNGMTITVEGTYDLCNDVMRQFFSIAQSRRRLVRQTTDKPIAEPTYEMMAIASNDMTRDSWLDWPYWKLVITVPSNLPGYADNDWYYQITGLRR